MIAASATATAAVRSARARTSPAGAGRARPRGCSPSGGKRRETDQHPERHDGHEADDRQLPHPVDRRAQHEGRQHARQRRHQRPGGPGPPQARQRRPRSPAPNTITISSEADHSQLAQHLEPQVVGVAHEQREVGVLGPPRLVGARALAERRASSPTGRPAAAHSCQRPVLVELSRCERVKSPSVYFVSPGGRLKSSNLPAGSNAATPTSAISAIARRRAPPAPARGSRSVPVGEPAPGPVEARRTRAPSSAISSAALSPSTRHRAAPRAGRSRGRRGRAAPRSRRPRRPPAIAVATSAPRAARGERAEDEHTHDGHRRAAARRGQVDRRGDRGHRARAPAPAGCAGRCATAARSSSGSARPARIASPFQ